MNNVLKLILKNAEMALFMAFSINLLFVTVQLHIPKHFVEFGHHKRFPEFVFVNTVNLASSITGSNTRSTTRQGTSMEKGC